MIFNRKAKQASCIQCKKKFDDKYNFCPYCGESRSSDEEGDFGMLGKRDLTDSELMRNAGMHQNLGVMDRVISSMINNVMRSMTKDFEKAEVQNLPNGIRIRLGGMPIAKKPVREPRQKAKALTEEQLEKFSKLPREQAKTQIKRLNDKIVYELSIPGISNPEDILISRLESGYEIKAIGQEKEGIEKIYVNSLPITLPIKSFTINPDKLLIEFFSKSE